MGFLFKSEFEKMYGDLVKENQSMKKIIEEWYEKQAVVYSYGYEGRAFFRYSVKENKRIGYAKTLIQSLFENKIIFNKLLDTLVSAKAEKKNPTINTFDIKTNMPETFDIAPIVSLALEMYAGTKDKKIQQRLTKIASLLDPNELLEQHPELIGVLNGELDNEALKKLKPEDIEKIASSIPLLDTVVVKSDVVNNNCTKILKAVETENMQYRIDKNLPNMLSTKSDVGSKFTLSPELHNEVLKNMPKTINGRPITELEISTYIYTKLCQVLRYDPVYRFNPEAANEQHCNFFRLSQIRTHDSVLCYEFAYIYSKFLEEFNIEHVICFGGDRASGKSIADGTLDTEVKRKSKVGEREGYYSSLHTYCLINAKHLSDEKHLFIADSTRTNYPWDIESLGVSEIDPKYYSGLVPVYINEHDYEERESELTEVKENIAKTVTNEHYPVPLSMVIEAYENITKGNTIKSISEEQKMEMLNSILEKSHYVREAKYYESLKHVLDALGINYEFVTRTNKDMYDINILIERTNSQTGDISYDLISPPNEIEHHTAEEILQKNKDGIIKWTDKRVKSSKVLQRLCSVEIEKTERREINE